MGPSIALAIPLALLSMLAMAGSNTINLPNGAALTVSIDDPVTSTEFEVPPGQPNIDVTVTGTASVGIGEPNATFVYVFDRSGSTGSGGGTGCSPILNCEKQFFVALNDAVIADGSTDEVGIVSYGTTATTDLGLVLPTDPAVNATINSFTAGGLTNCGDALQLAVNLASSSSNGSRFIVFASDGLCNEGPHVSSVVVPANIVVNSIAIGSGSDCTSDDGTGTLNQVARNGGQCFAVADPGNLPDLIQNLIGSTLDSLEISVDGGAPQPITTLPSLPQDGAISVSYTSSADDLGPGDHTICVTAKGSDVTGGTANVTQCETIHLLQLRATPEELTNELGSNSQHTVTANIDGPASHIGGRTVGFSVGGTNAGTLGTCSPTPDCKTDAGGAVSFTYSVPIELSSLGTDTITVNTQIAGHDTSVAVTKHWVDTTAPVPVCGPGPNPSGNIPPPVHQDEYFKLTATDAVDPNVKIFVVDSGTGTEFGPFASGTNIRYTQAPGVTPSIRPGAGAVQWFIKGQGDMQVYAVDSSLNKSELVVSCLVAPPPS